MATRSLHRLRHGGTGATPLLGFRDVQRGGRIGVALLIRQLRGWGVLPEPSMRVRESAAEQVEQRQNNWFFSRTAVFLDSLWHVALLAAVAGVLAVSVEERPSTPLRIWIVGYAARCVVHMVCVWIEYQRRQPAPRAGREEGVNSTQQGQDNAWTSGLKQMASATVMFSVVWWVAGVYWVFFGGQALSSDSPRLYWLCIVLLAYDTLFVFLFAALAVIGTIVLCCFLPLIIALLAVGNQEGASDEDIRQLPKYTFRKINGVEEHSDDSSDPSAGLMVKCDNDSPIERFLSAEDAACCICLSAYEDGAQLYQLPCGHHFHCECINRWLHINATCPLCKASIIRDTNPGMAEA